jgi:hypothetical protein
MPHYKKINFKSIIEESVKFTFYSVNKAFN